MQKLGLALIVLSFSPWLGIPFILPFLPLTISQKAVLAPVWLVVAEVTFWIGVLLVGKEVVQRYQNYLNFQYLKNQLKRILCKSSE